MSAAHLSSKGLHFQKEPNDSKIPGFCNHIFLALWIGFVDIEIISTKTPYFET